MRAISLHQPHASLSVHGYKLIETRGKRISFRGELAIAATAKTPDDYWRLCKREPFEQALSIIATPSSESDIRRLFRKQGRWDKILPQGAVLGIVRVLDCVPVEEIRDGLSPAELAFGDYSDGRFAWPWEVIERFETPIPAKGGQFIWTWDATKEQP